MEAVLDFEKPIATLEKKLTDLKDLEKQQGVHLTEEIKSLEKKLESLITETFAKLTPWQKVQLSRHPNRPYAGDYIDALFPTFMELHGDRCFGQDAAIMAGIAEWPPQLPSGTKTKSDPKSVLILAHQKGRTTKEKMQRNFGMARPEGYRKSMRLMEMANRLRIPILTLIDTPGAYPGIETEERGQAQAIAESIRLMFDLDVPIVSVIIGEGGSGGALALAAADRVYMQKYSTYSVISPEGCASILWSDSKVAPRASEVLKMSPDNLISLGVIDGIIEEPSGGAHRHWQQAFEFFGKFLIKNVHSLFDSTAKLENLRSKRIEKFRTMGMKAVVSTQTASESSPS